VVDYGRYPQNLRGPRAGNGTFVTDLMHEFGHAVVAQETGQYVERVVLEGIEVVGDVVNVRIGGHTVRHIGLRPSQLWFAAVVDVAGLVAERLHADRDASFDDPVGLFLTGREYLSDLENAIRNVLDSREVLSMGSARRSANLSKAVDEARAIILPRLADMEREANLWKHKVIESPAPDLIIPWNIDT
jgi:hypothetical protein